MGSFFGLVTSMWFSLARDHSSIDLFGVGSCVQGLKQSSLKSLHRVIMTLVSHSQKGIYHTICGAYTRLLALG